MLSIFAKKNQASYFRNFMFGVEDGLVSTVGLLSGVAIAGMSQKMILLTGTVLIFVEAFSMAVGSFLSEYSEEEYVKHARASYSQPRLDSIVMFLSYLLAGFVPLLPYIFFELSVAFQFSVLLSLVVLFLLGVVAALISKTSVWKTSLRMGVMGGIAIGVGVGIGSFLNQF